MTDSNHEFQSEPPISPTGPAFGYAEWDAGDSERSSKFSVFDGLSRFLLSRPVGYLGLAGVIIALLLPKTGLNFGTCGMIKSFGVPCPGCGLTRSVTSFFQGDFALSFGYHPLGWAFALAFAVTGTFSILPTRAREAMLLTTEKKDRWIGVGLLVFCVILAIYGIVRIGLVVSGHPDYEWWASEGEMMPPFMPDLFPDVD